MSGRNAAIAVMALAFAALELAAGVPDPYGLFHDEFYYWSCARRPALGYVDHPPLAPWILVATRSLLGDGFLGFRLVPALCGAAVVALTALMARHFGAGLFGEWLAALCSMSAPAFLAFFNFFSVNAHELFFWTAACFALVQLQRSGDERWWIAFGAIVGIGLLNKHTIALLGVGVAVGVLATPLRAHLGRRWIWLGAALALVLAAPNLLWQVANGWPSLEFYRAVDTEKNVPTTIAEALQIQLVGYNPGALPVWLAGVLFLLLAPAARRQRALGWVFLTLFVVVVTSGQRRGDRIAGVYPMAFAAGAAFWDGWARAGWRAWLRWLLPVPVLGLGILLLPAVLPVLPPEDVAAYFDALGEEPEIEASDAEHEIPLLHLGRLEWEEVADAVVAAAEGLSPADRERAVVLAPNLAVASAVEYYGAPRGLPPVASPHNTWALWRDEVRGRDVAISIGFGPETLRRAFAETEWLAPFECQHCASWRPNMPIAISRRPVQPVGSTLAELRHFGSAVGLGYER